MEASKALVAYMMQPETQVATLRATNFFPVVDVDAARRHAGLGQDVRPGDRRA